MPPHKLFSSYLSIVTYIKYFMVLTDYSDYIILEKYVPECTRGVSMPHTQQPGCPRGLSATDVDGNAEFLAEFDDAIHILADGGHARTCLW